MKYTMLLILLLGLPFVHASTCNGGPCSAGGYSPAPPEPVVGSVTITDGEYSEVSCAQGVYNTETGLCEMYPETVDVQPYEIPTITDNEVVFSVSRIQWLFILSIILTLIGITLYFISRVLGLQKKTRRDEDEHTEYPSD